MKQSTHKNIVILGDGDYPAAPYPLSLLETADTVICCDGSVVKLLSHGKRPDYIVGDMDTLEARMPIRSITTKPNPFISRSPLSRNAFPY